MNLAENIYRYRSAKNWSQTELAEALDVSRQSISKWENGTSVPELDKLIKMRELFGVTIDELVFDTPKEQKEDMQVIESSGHVSTKWLIGIIMFVFGMILFLLSIFWGDHLYFGEVVGELSSVVIVLLSVSMLATNNFKVLAGSTLIYIIYTVVCFGILNVTSVSNYIFTGVAGWIILVWLIVWGTNATKGLKEKKDNITVGME